MEDRGLIGGVLRGVEGRDSRVGRVRGRRLRRGLFRGVRGGLRGLWRV